VNLLQRLDTHPDIACRFGRVVLVDPLQYGVQKIPESILRNPRYRFVRGSIYDPAIAEDTIGEGDLVIHLAAEVNSFTAPQATSSDDAPGYLQRLADNSVGRLLFLSSADAFHALRGLPFVAFRPVTIFGPHQYPGWLVPRVITQAINGEQISLTGDGSVRRDWIHVSDICDLLVKAALYEGGNIHGEVFNVGTGQELDVLSLTRHVLDAVGRDESLITFVPDRAGDIRRQVTRGTRARTTFGWQPVMALRDGLTRTVTWYQHATHPH
jgi:dTDP-glucose 4,6-dehydratase